MGDENHTAIVGIGSKVVLNDRAGPVAVIDKIDIRNGVQRYHLVSAGTDILSAISKGGDGHGWYARSDFQHYPY
jgi:hypothetical protein